MKIKNYELLVAITGDEPKPLLQYGHDGHTFVEGKPGTEFCLVFRNNSSDRVLVVPALDGLSCMDGAPATGDSEGYVVEPYRRVIIKGWRTSLEKSAAFTFEKKKDGYVKAIGAPTENVGVVGALVYREKVSEPQDNEIWRRLRAAERELEEQNRRPILIDRPYPVPYPVPYPGYPKPYYDPPFFWMTTSGGVNSGCLGSTNFSVNSGCLGSTNFPAVRQAENTKVVETAAKFNLAAGWGEERKDEVREVEFVRGEFDAEFAIYYTDRNALKEMGIDLNTKPAVTKLPQAFTRTFCKPPKK